MTKTTILAATFAGGFGLCVNAGGMSEPLMEADIIVEQVSTPSSGSAMLPVILFALLVAAASAG